MKKQKEPIIIKHVEFKYKNHPYLIVLCFLSLVLSMLLGYFLWKDHQPKPAYYPNEIEVHSIMIMVNGTNYICIPKYNGAKFIQ